MAIPEDRRLPFDLDLDLPAESGPPVDPALSRGPCPSCGLTPTGDEALRRELDHLAATSEGAWHAELCAECGGVCFVVDHDEDWALGAPPLGPVMLAGPGPRSAPPEDPASEPSLLPPPQEHQLDDPRDVVREILARTEPAQHPEPPALKQATPPSEK